MLPSLPFKSKAIAATLVAALALPAPALAWGKNEQNFTKGVLAAIIAGAIIKDMNRNAHAQPQPQPVYVPPRPPVYQPPVYQPPVYQPPVYQPPVYQPPVYQPAPSVYTTPAAQAFNSYSRNERLRIQSTLANYGYYRGGIDGSFGPGTYQAVAAYAQAQGRLADLNTRGGAYGLYDGLIY